MRKFWLALVICFAPFAVPRAYAQNFTTVTGTITDPNGLPYSSAVVTAVIVPSGTNPAVPPPCNGQTSTNCATPGLVRVNTDLNGSFSMSLASNAVIVPSGTQWQFTVTTPGVAPPTGTGAQSLVYTSTGSLISGSSVNISAQLSAAAPPLTHVVTTFMLPLASTAVITSITNLSSTSAIFGCNTPGCSLAPFVGSVINVGQGLNNLPLACQGPMTVASTSGNTATMINMTAGPCPSMATANYANVLGQFANIMLFVPAQGNNVSGSAPTQFGYIFVDYDGKMQMSAVNNGVTRSSVIADATGQAGLVGYTYPASIGVTDVDAAGHGGICISATPVIYPTPCPGTRFTWDPGNGSSGLITQMGNTPLTAPSFTLTGTSTVGGNSLSYSGGVPSMVVHFSSQLIVPTAGATTTVSFGNIYTAPATGARVYEVKGEVLCATNCGAAQTVYVSASTTDPLSNVVTSYTNPSTGAAGNLRAISNAPPASPWSFANGRDVPFDFMLLPGPSQPISFNVVTTGGASQPQYYVQLSVILY